ncbi:hypothetical protein RGUI_2249 [Rhodovulum sp. P5]|uniref:hypothetical protein n=1 Tax=Rhodovulum sp. P5 TaxID=1564506 RepID=UPI0009C35BA2|nr:hypothetical protein [Rhodovulum sp. P5]ARE40390.1 hypothetical protein RGUI_2249 [Rhodovulum sp. P5]
MTLDKADEIADVLERERVALRNADFKSLNKLSDEKERLFADLGDTPFADAETLKRLLDMAKRNETLLDAVRRGIDSAAQRLKRLREPAEPLDTYSQTGQRTRLDATKRSLTRRA